MASIQYYDVIIRPVITEKSMADMGEKKYTFLVHPEANKTQIKEAVEKMFEGTKVKSVNTINMDGKKKRRGMVVGKTAKTKKAIVALTEESKDIEIFEGLYQAVRVTPRKRSFLMNLCHSIIAICARKHENKFERRNIMGIKSYNPYTPSRRHMTGSDFSEITAANQRNPSLLPLKKNAGRNNQGKITVRHQGGGSRRKYRIIDFKRRKDGIPATVKSIEYDPNRTANIALICYADGEKAYILAPEGLKSWHEGYERR